MAKESGKRVKEVDMICYIVTIEVKKENIEAFIKATIENHTATRKEAGNIRFDILQQSDSPGNFTLYEVYESEKAREAHRQTPHYLKWKNAAEEWMAAPRKGISFYIISPIEREKW